MPATHSSVLRIDDLVNSNNSNHIEAPPLSPASSVSSLSSDDFCIDDEELSNSQTSQLAHIQQSPIINSEAHIIKIENLEPLELAKKKHYVPVQTTHRVHKKSLSAKPQGRPFNDSLCARFLFFTTVDNLLATVLNQRDRDTVRLLDSFPETFIGFDNTGSYKEYEVKDTNNTIIEAILNNSRNMNIMSLESLTFQQQTIEFENFNKNNIHTELCSLFGIKDFSFVKIIRNTKGKLIKFEIMSTLDNKNLDISSIKKYITYPRYKANMKIYMINGKFERDVWFYNDLRMLLWDIRNLEISNKRILVNNILFS